MEEMRGLLIVGGAPGALLAASRVLLAVRVPALPAARWWSGASPARARVTALGAPPVRGLRDVAGRPVAAPAPLHPGVLARTLEPTRARRAGGRATWRRELVEPLATLATLASLAADRAERERVQVDLVVDARDAMPDGGTCTLHGAPDGADGAPVPAAPRAPTAPPRAPALVAAGPHAAAA